MNKTVDVLNGRYFAEGISNNIIHNDKNNRAVEEMKWATLNAILTELDITDKERESREQKFQQSKRDVLFTHNVQGIQIDNQLSNGTY